MKSAVGNESMQENALQIYNSQWPLLFCLEQETLTRVLDDHLSQIEHIGGTAVPTIWSTPIIDIALILKSPQALDQCMPLLARIGYTIAPEMTSDQPPCLIRQGDTVQYRCYCLLEHDTFLKQAIIFRDFLRSNPQEAEFYSEIKKKAAQLYSSNHAEYLKNKKIATDALLQKALKWYKDNA